MKKLIIALFAVAIATVFAPAKEVKAAYNSLSAGAHAEMLRSFYNVPAYEKDFADKYNYLEQLKRDGAPASDIAAAETALTNASVKLAQLNSLVSYQLTQSSSLCDGTEQSGDLQFASCKPGGLQCSARNKRCICSRSCKRCRIKRLLPRTGSLPEVETFQATGTVLLAR